jgi:outer membrane protein assembly factor BamB
MSGPAPRRKRIDVGGFVKRLALSPSGMIFAVTTHGTLVCLDQSGLKAWERQFVPSSSLPLVLRVADDGHPWVGVDGTIVEIDHDGRDRFSLKLDLDRNERLGSFLLVPDGFYVCLYRPTHGDQGPRVIRLDRSGSSIWSTTLPVGTINFRGVVEAGVHTGWTTQPMQPWRPETWEPVPDGESEPLLVSGDRLLASFCEFVRSGIGCSYALNTENGALLWVTEPSPTGTLAIAGSGRFYQGLQGYGAFETRLLGPDGSVLRRWDSHGYLVISEDGRVYSVEMENRLPSRMRFVTLLDDGGIARGPSLDGYYTTYPIVTDKREVVFSRNGKLVLIDKGMTMEIINRDRLLNNGVMSRMVLSPEGSLLFSVDHEVWIVQAGLGSLAKSPWPCGGANIRNNPVGV